VSPRREARPERVRVVPLGRRARQRTAATVDEALQFPVAPAGVQVARRDNGDEDRRAAQLLFQIRAEVVGGAEARVAPQDRLLPEFLVELDLQALVKRGDPAFLADGLIVEVAVADEHVIAEAGDVGHEMNLEASSESTWSAVTLP